MLRALLLYLFPVFTCFNGSSEEQYLPIAGQLPAELRECSGMAVLPDGRLAMINDSGNEPLIYLTDTAGNLLQVLESPFLHNRDWEELLFHQGHFYLGDFGNNANKRQDLLIYKVAFDGDSLGKVEEIRFSYARQKHYPPPAANRHFDLEAMVALGDSIYLFSKNRSDPFNGYSYQYKLPQQAGDYRLAPVDSFFTGNGTRECFWITGAALEVDRNLLCLLSYRQMWLFSDFKGSHFFKGNYRVIRFDEFSQKEAVSFGKWPLLYFTDEKNLMEGGYLYYLTLAP